MIFDVKHFFDVRHFFPVEVAATTATLGAAVLATGTSAAVGGAGGGELIGVRAEACANDLPTDSE